MWSCGLVDAMYSFGVKTPSSGKIMNNDFWWTTASQLVSFFNRREDEIASDNNKIFKEITDEDIHKNTPDEITKLELKDNTKQHPIVGTLHRAFDLCHCETLLGTLKAVKNCMDVVIMMIMIMTEMMMMMMMMTVKVRIQIDKDAQLEGSKCPKDGLNLGFLHIDCFIFI